MGRPTPFERLLDDLTRLASARGFNNKQWAQAAGIREESLSRMRRRASCDFASLAALAEAVGAKLAVTAPVETSADGHFPARVGREYEQQLLTLCVSGVHNAHAWAAAGPRFFMAGLAVMLASARGFDRRRMLELADALHPGITEPETFGRWLGRSPVRASRFLPLLEAAMRDATRSAGA